MSKAKRIDKVAGALAKDPHLTTREVEEKTGVSKSSVATYRKEELDKLGQKDDRIVSLTDRDFELMQIIQQRKFDRMKDEEKPVNDSDINNWDKEAKARYSLFRGDATDDKGGLKEQNILYTDMQAGMNITLGTNE